MNYELAKELKKAGYPIQFSEAKFLMNKPWEATLSPETEHYGYVFPTLEELIEACGEGFANLEREDEGFEDGGVQWIAFKVDTVDEGGTGSTPTEAVARLWLALHKKS